MFTPWDAQSQQLQSGWADPILRVQAFQQAQARDQIARQRQIEDIQMKQAFEAQENEKQRAAQAAIAAQSEKAAAERVALSSRLNLQAKAEEARQQQVEIARQMGAKIADDATYEEAAGAVQKAAGRGYSQAIKDLKDASVNSAGLLNSPQHQAMYGAMVTRGVLADPNVQQYLTNKQIEGLTLGLTNPGAPGALSLDQVQAQIKKGDWKQGAFQAATGIPTTARQTTVERVFDTAKLTAAQTSMQQMMQLPDIANSPQHLEVMRQMQEALGRGQLYSAYLKDPTEYANAVADAAGYTPKVPEVTTPKGTLPAGTPAPLPPVVSPQNVPMRVAPAPGPMLAPSPAVSLPVNRFGNVDPNSLMVPANLGGAAPVGSAVPVGAGLSGGWAPVNPAAYSPANNFVARPPMSLNEAMTLLNNQAVAQQAQGGPVVPVATNPGSLPFY